MSSRKKKRQKKQLGIVPRALLGAALAGSVPASVIPACASDSASMPDSNDGSLRDRPAGEFFAVDANSLPDRPEFVVDANFDAAAPPDGPEFVVDANTDA